MQTSKELYHQTSTEKKLIFSPDSTSDIIRTVLEQKNSIHKSNSFKYHIDLVLNLFKWTSLFYLYSIHPIPVHFKILLSLKGILVA